MSNGKRKSGGDTWFKCYRSIRNNPFWQDKPFARGQAWVDLLAMTQGVDNEGVDRFGNVVFFERGKVYESVSSMAESWGWTRQRVQRFLKNLEKLNMIRCENRTGYGTVVTIENWGKFQDSRTPNRTGDNTGDDTGRVQVATHNKESIRKIKKDKEEAAGTVPLNADGPPPKGTPEYERWRNQ